MSETVDRPIHTAPAQAYAMKARRDQDALEVIAGIFSLFDIKMHALIMEQLAYDMHVTSPLGHSISMNSVYRNCPIIIQAREFLADLIPLPL